MSKRKYKPKIKKDSTIDDISIQKKGIDTIAPNKVEEAVEKLSSLSRPDIVTIPIYKEQNKDVNMIGLKQNRGSKNCVAVVLAMATNTSVNNVQKFLGINEHIGMSDLQMCRYLAEKGFALGLGIENGWNKQLIMNSKENLKAVIDLTKYPAILIVQSEHNEDEAHAVYWDGGKIWDPNPDTQNNLDVENYKIYSWTPIRRTENKYPTNTKVQFTI